MIIAYISVVSQTVWPPSAKRLWFHRLWCLYIGCQSPGEYSNLRSQCFASAGHERKTELSPLHSRVGGREHLLRQTFFLLPLTRPLLFLGEAACMVPRQCRCSLGCAGLCSAKIKRKGNLESIVYCTSPLVYGSRVQAGNNPAANSAARQAQADC